MGWGGAFFLKNRIKQDQGRGNIETKVGKHSQHYNGRGRQKKVGEVPTSMFTNQKETSKTDSAQT